MIQCNSLKYLFYRNQSKNCLVKFISFKDINPTFIIKINSLGNHINYF